mgnify:CR=1 FL=1
MDYDGDQVTVKGVYSDEANAELMKIIDSRRNLLGLDGRAVRTSEKEAIQAMYSLTRVLDEDTNKRGNYSLSLNLYLPPLKL